MLEETSSKTRGRAARHLLLLAGLIACSCTHQEAAEDLAGMQNADVAARALGESCSSTHCFSIWTAADTIENWLVGSTQVVKYAFKLQLGNAAVERAQGPARTWATPPEMEFSPRQRYNPASVGKAITAVATLQLLDANGVSVDAPIYPYLPPSWYIPNNNRTITFYELLTHSSGLRDETGGTTHDGVRLTLEREIQLDDKTDSYQSVNYAVLRVLVARLVSPIYEGEVDIAEAFIRYVNDGIFSRLGIYDVSYTPSSTPVLFYPVPPDNSQGTDYGDWSLEPGSAGGFLSTHELTVFIDATFNGVLLPDHVVNDIWARGLGFWDFGTRPDGSRCVGVGGFFPGDWNGGAQLSSALVHCNNGLSAMLVINGRESAGDTIPRALDEAYTPL